MKEKLLNFISNMKEKLKNFISDMKEKLFNFILVIFFVSIIGGIVGGIYDLFFLKKRINECIYKIDGKEIVYLKPKSGLLKIGYEYYDGSVWSEDGKSVKLTVKDGYISQMEFFNVDGDLVCKRQKRHGKYKVTFYDSKGDEIEESKFKIKYDFDYQDYKDNLSRLEDFYDSIIIESILRGVLPEDVIINDFRDFSSVTVTDPFEDLRVEKE